MKLGKVINYSSKKYVGFYPHFKRIMFSWDKQDLTTAINTMRSRFRFPGQSKYLYDLQMLASESGVLMYIRYVFTNQYCVESIWQADK